MFLKNFFCAIGAEATYGSAYCVNTDGQLSYLYGNTYHPVANIADAIKVAPVTSYKSTVGARLVMGSGSEPETINDYKLSGNIVTGCSVSVTKQTESNENYISFGSILSITNGNNSSITIGEIGIVYYYSGSAFMLERTVLNEPLVIQAGGIGTITYAVQLNFPT